MWQGWHIWQRLVLSGSKPTFAYMCRVVALVQDVWIVVALMQERLVVEITYQTDALLKPHQNRQLEDRRSGRRSAASYVYSLQLSVFNTGSAQGAAIIESLLCAFFLRAENANNYITLPSVHVSRHNCQSSELHKP